jgi:hypothetical protein
MFVLAIVGIIAGAIVQMAIYQECKQEGGKGCLRKATRSHNHDLYIHEDE